MPTHHCDAEIFDGLSINLAFNYCYQIDFFVNGVIRVDDQSPNTCVGAVFQSWTLSKFKEYSGSDAIYEEGDLGWKGVIRAVYRPNEPYDVQEAITGPKEFHVEFFLPVCSKTFFQNQLALAGQLG